MHAHQSLRFGQVLVLLAVVVISGCGGYFLPAPTMRTVKESDLVGTWTYRPLGTDVSVTLVLNADGSFDQSVQMDASMLTQKGTWHVDGSDLILAMVLVDFNGWNAHTVSWSIIDRDGSPSGFAILGGTLDPDAWTILQWDG